jgi:hypothetical protein
VPYQGGHKEEEKLKGKPAFWGKEEIGENERKERERRSGAVEG